MNIRTSVTVRVAEFGDLLAVAAIERLAFGDPWTRGMFSAHLPEASGDIFLIAHDSADIVVGFAIARVVSDESELFNIAVHPERRRGGVGAVLLDAVLCRCSAAGATDIWLEVRASNDAALSLYLSRGFATAGRRKGYYSSPREDALVMRAELNGELVRELVRELDPAGVCTKMVLHAGTGLPSQSGGPILSSTSQPSRQETI